MNGHSLSVQGCAVQGERVTRTRIVRAGSRSVRETAVWFGGPRDDDEMHLSPELEHDLHAFDDWYRNAEDPLEQCAVGAGVRHDFEREGERLVQALARELGAPFSVAVIDPGGRAGSRTFPVPVSRDEPPGPRCFRRDPRRRSQTLTG